MKNFILILIIVFSISVNAKADRAVVVATFGTCDYFVADGPKGLYVLEWYGGKFPIEGDVFFGDVGSYGMKEIEYEGGSTGRVWVEDFLETSSAAASEIRDHC